MQIRKQMQVQSRVQAHIQSTSLRTMPIRRDTEGLLQRAAVQVLARNCGG